MSSSAGIYMCLMDACGVCYLFKEFEASCIVLLWSVTVNPPSSASIVFKQLVHFLCDCVARPVFAACFLKCFVLRGSDKREEKPPEYYLVLGF